MKSNFLTISLIAYSSFSQAGFESIDDADLGAISGQAGISIESELYATIGSLEYTDEGSLSVNDIVIGGANKQTYFGVDWGPGSHSGIKLDGSIIKVDVLNDGDLVISGAPSPTVGNLIDFGLSTGSIELHSSNGLVSSTLVDSVNVSGIIAGFTSRIDAASLHILTEADVGIDDLDIDISGLNMKIEDAFIVDSTYFEKIEAFGAGSATVDNLTAYFAVDLYADDEGLHINPQSLEFDMGIGSVSIADESIGSFSLNNINLTQSSMIVSGHP